MESHKSNLKDWLFMEAKIAAAVAIIKSKPPGMSGRAHAQALAIRLRRQEESWRDRAQSLERELLRLRQDSLIRRMTSNTTSSSSCIEAAGTTDFLSLSVEQRLDRSLGLGTPPLPAKHKIPRQLRRK